MQFDSLKQRLEGRRLENNEEMEMAVHEWLRMQRRRNF